MDLTSFTYTDPIGGIFGGERLHGKFEKTIRPLGLMGLVFAKT
jgi:hypothetical protein